MSSFILKVIAIITMCMDHIGYVIFGHFSYLNYFGRISFPIFAFQISEGYIHTNNLKKYFLRLFVFALISQFPFMLFYQLVATGFKLNIFFTLILGLTCIYIYDKSNNKILSIIASIIIGLIAKYTNCDYGFYGIAIILIFYIFKNNSLKATIAFILATFLKYLINILKTGFSYIYFYLLFFSIISIVFISLYNGKKGKNTKYLFYLFYPIHLLLLYGLHQILS